MDAQYSPEIECRWKSYGTYRLLIWVWMMNEVNLMYSATDMATRAFYLYSVVFVLGVVFIGIPMVYSEICIAQFTNCTITTVWNFFPLFRSVAYGTIYLVVLKIIGNLVIGSYYLTYTFYAALDPPPWFTCNDFNTSMCMVKRINISVFQHCLEADYVFNIDCGMQTATGFFFAREIGEQNTSNSFNCLHQWKALLISMSMNFTLFLLLIKNFKTIQVATKILAFFVGFLLLLLFLAVQSTKGSWFSSTILVNLSRYNFWSVFKTLREGFLSLGVGTGMILYLSKDVAFRSPAAMTATCTCLFSAFYCVVFSLIAFNGIKAMSYYHGGETNVIEMGSNALFDYFATISEILMYLDEQPIWSFAWFSIISLCILMNLWMMYLYLGDLLIENLNTAKQYQNASRFLLLLFMSFLAWPFSCSDLVSSITDALEFIQLSNSFFLSISLYWIYDFRKHSVDIIFMTGVKTTLFWKICWVINPILITIMMFVKWYAVSHDYYEDSYIVSKDITNGEEIHLDEVIFYVLVLIYYVIVFGGMVIQSIYYYRFKQLSDLIRAHSKWGPKDKVLFKSRQMFIPQIMTTEFLYRRIRIHGLTKKQNPISIKNVKPSIKETVEEKMEWSVLTSN